MATLKTIRKRIVSVKNTQKITKAMKMVAAAKLRRAQTRLTNARPYAARMAELLAQTAALVENPPPILQGRPFDTAQGRPNPRKAEFLILTSDRGLCGGFNGNLLRRVEDFLKTSAPKYEEVRIRVYGKKGRDFFRARKRELAEVKTGRTDSIRFEDTVQIAGPLIQGFEAGEFDEFYLVYNRFKSAISQEVRIEKILPIEPIKRPTAVPEYLYEPSKGDVLGKLVPRAVATVIYRAFLESLAGEYGARMSAMESATTNCTEMIYRLTLQLNRIRQAAITKELMDIVNGAEALK